MKTLPNPCPTLREGLSLGAKEHSGFCECWNWVMDFFRNIRENVVTKVNDRTGKIKIVAGDGIDVVASGDTITIGLGSGENTDEDNTAQRRYRGEGYDKAFSKELEHFGLEIVPCFPVVLFEIRDSVGVIRKLVKHGFHLTRNRPELRTYVRKEFKHLGVGV